MSRLERREPRTLFPELLDWLESPVTALRPGLAQAIRVEDFVVDDDYVIRAELPGLDPGKDVEITVTGGTLHIHAERQEWQKETHRSEFRYGTFSRSLALPAEIDPDEITADYDKGILTVRVPLPKAAKREAKRITVQNVVQGETGTTAD
ncbi:Hsp20/alpha crystallin family protein [Actinomadura vinacea]|uniref:Hsp20/alpha crystallin family protein n=1 Tax=Actinomadura vinacea TaxID=115336 RepID=A0ABN3JQX6_9ACTN